MLTLNKPVHYILELTPECNNRCTGCGSVFTDKTDSFLSAAQWQEVLNRISPHAANLRISGGEPTLHPEFADIINIISNINVSLSLFTNARWQHPDKIIRVLKNLPQKKGLLVSLHGATPDIHDSFTGVIGSFAETVQNIRRAIDAGLNVATSTIITRANYFTIDKIIAFTSGLGIECAFFARYIPVQNNDITPIDEQLKQAINIVESHRTHGAKVQFSVCIPQCFASSSSEGCLAGVTYCVIDPWGNVRPCTHSPMICGNLLEQSIEEIWHGAEMQQWRNMIPTQCHNCLEFSKCHGGCRAAAMLACQEKDPLIGKPILEKTQEQSDELVLYENACPTANFTLRSESFGYVLINGSRVIPVSHDAKPIIDMMNGQSTLRQIQEHFGQDALNIIGLLYQKGFAEMKD